MGYRLDTKLLRLKTLTWSCPHAHGIPDLCKVGIVFRGEKQIKMVVTPKIKAMLISFCVFVVFGVSIIVHHQMSGGSKDTPISVREEHNSEVKADDKVDTSDQTNLDISTEIPLT